MLMLPDDEERQIATQRRITGLNALDTTEAVFSDHVSEEDKPCASVDCIKSHVVLLYAIGIQ